jgi:hypothetical protein
MKKAFCVIIISNLLVILSYGQESYIKNRVNFKTGYSRYATNRSVISNGKLKALTVGNYRIEANYGISNLIETGIYVGYSKFDSFRINWADTSFNFKNCSTPFYGINCNFHLLPFLIKEDDFRFDLYISGKFGGLFFASPTGFFPTGSAFEYGIGGGLSFYIWKHLGVYAEYTYGKYFFRDNSNLRYGLTMKF